MATQSHRITAFGIGAAAYPSRDADPIGHSPSRAVFMRLPRSGDRADAYIGVAATAMVLAGALLMLANIVHDLMLFDVIPTQSKDRIWMLDVDSEKVPYTWLSSIGLFTNSVLLLAIALLRHANGTRHWIYWMVLAAGFSLLSMDEVIGMHERMNFDIGNQRVGWSYLAGFASLAVLGAFASFLWQLPTQVRLWFVVAGAMFVGGAAGAEIIGYKIFGQWSPDQLGYRAMVWVEESLELAGSLLFLLTLTANFDVLTGKSVLRD